MLRGKMTIVKATLVWLMMVGYFCPIGKSAIIDNTDCPSSVVIHPDAQVFIGVFLDIHNPAQNCLTINSEAVEVYEILRWFTTLLNQNFGEVASRIIKDYYIPGIPIGLKVFDTCGQDKFPAAQLKSLFPATNWTATIRNSDQLHASCVQHQGHDKQVIGLIDGSETLDQKSIRTALSLFHIPYLRLRTSNYEIPAEFSKVLVDFLKTLAWNQAVIIYDGEDSSSVEVVEQFDRIVASSADQVCVTMYANLHEDLDTLAMRIRAVSPLPAVIVIDSKYRPRWNALYSKLETSHRYWFLSSAANLDAFPVSSNSTQSVYFMNHHPGHIPAFETYWNRRKSLSLSKQGDSQWILEYLAQKKKCRLAHTQITETNRQLSECMSVNLVEKSVDLAQRHRLIPPVIHAMNFLANALRNAWSTECKQVPSMCDKLRSLKPADFHANYFTPLQIKHGGPGSRVPPGISGERRVTEPVDRMANVRYGLYSLKNVTVQEVLVEKLNGGIQILKNDTESTRIDCLKCVNCASFREEKTTTETLLAPLWLSSLTTTSSPLASTEIIDPLNSEESLLKEVLLEANDALEIASQSEVGDSRSLADEEEGQLEETKTSRQNVLIPALFPIHLPGPTPLQCGATVNPESIVDIEAFLWALEQINRNTHFLPDVELGAVIFDTCSSSLKTTHILSSVISSEGDAMVEELDLDPDTILTFISAVGSTETQSVLEVLGSVGTTTISTKDRSGPRQPLNLYHLQIEVPMGIVAQAMVETLVQLEWQNIVVMRSQDDLEALSGFNAFYQLTKTHNICSEVYLMPVSEGDLLVPSLQNTKAVIVLWLSAFDTQRFWESYNLTGYNTNNSIFLVADGINDITQDLKANVISFQSGRVFVPEFVESFKQLDPRNNTRNPWFQEYWDQIHNCTKCKQESSLNPKLSQLSISSTAVIQAVYMVASAMSRVVADFCEPRGNKPFCISNTTELRQVMNNYLRFTGTDRADDPNGEFSFNQNGYGNTNLEILVKTSSQPWVKQGIYSISEGLSFNGSEISLSNQTISLSHFQATCPVVITETAPTQAEVWEPSVFMEMNSNASFKIISLLPVHHAGHRPFTCGAINSPAIWDNINILLASIDDANHHLRTEKLGVMVIDSCERNELAQKRLLSLLANEDARFPQVALPQIVLTLSVGANAALALSSVYNEEPVAHIALNMSTTASNSELESFSSLSFEPSASEELQATFDLLVQLDWKHVVIFYADNPRGRQRRTWLKEKIAATEICLGGDVVISSNSVVLEAIAQSLPPKTAAVILLDTPDEINFLFDVAFHFNLTTKLIFILNTAWGLQTTPYFVNALSFALEKATAPPYNHLNQSSFQPSWPRDWYEEFYQEYFQCQFNDSKVTSPHAQPCGSHSLDYRFSYANDIVYIIQTVKKVIETIELNCTQTECILDDRQSWNLLLKQALKKPLQVWDLRTREPLLIGTYKNSLLELRWNLVAHEVMECMEGPCLQICAVQSPIYANRNQPVPLALDNNFHTSWGIAVLIFTSLGLLAVLICIWYFYHVLPVRLALLAYLSLLGLLFLYVDNLFFLMQANSVTCGLRRFFTGFAYTVIFSAMLTKVTTTWKKLGYPVGSLNGTVSSNAREFASEDVKRISGSVLYASALIIVEVILLVAWLLLIAPEVDVIMTGPFWRCNPATTFEFALILSLTYPLLMLITIVVFGMCIIRSSEGMGEIKAMIGCCLGIGFTWIGMSLAATQASYSYRDLAIIIGNLVCGKILLIGLHGKMIYQMVLNRSEGNSVAILSQFSNKNLPMTSTHLMSQIPGQSYGKRLDCGTTVSDGGDELRERDIMDLSAFGVRRTRSSGRSNFGMASSVTSSEGDASQNSNVPSPVFPYRHQHCGSQSSYRSQTGTVEGDRDLSEAEEVHVTRMRIPRSTLQGNPMVALPYYQTDGNESLPNVGLLPLVRRIGSRQMLLLGDESSVHGRVSRI